MQTIGTPGVGCGGPAGSPPPPRRPMSSSLPPSPTSGPGRGAPSGPHESGAAAGGLLSPCCPRYACASLAVDRSSGGLRGAGLGVGWGSACFPPSAPGYPALTQSLVSLPFRREPHWGFFPPLPRGGIIPRIRPRPQIRRDNPLNLSILLSGGKETNQDSLSSGERRGKSPAPNPRPTGGRGKCGV